MDSKKPVIEEGQVATTTSTPLHTKDWYLKWVSSVILLLGMILTAQNIYPINLFVNIIGIFGWLIVSMIWNDRALIIINAVGISIYANGIVAYVMKGVENG